MANTRTATTARQRKVMRIAAKELREFKRAFEKAARLKDRAALERLIHDSFTLVDPQGREVNKKALIDDIVAPASDFMKKFRRSERHTVMHSSGKAARETAAVNLSGKLRRHGNITGRYTNTATFLKGPDGWQMAGNTLHKL